MNICIPEGLKISKTKVSKKISNSRSAPYSGKETQPHTRESKKKKKVGTQLYSRKDGKINCKEKRKKGAEWNKKIVMFMKKTR